MANNSKTALTWQPVDTDTLPTATANAYKAYKAEMEKVNKLRAKFEDLFAADLIRADIIPQGHNPLFGYRFGKLAVAFGEKPANKGKAPMISLKGVK